MRHDKVFVVPEKLSEVLPDDTNSTNDLPFSPEAFIGVPLFTQGKSFAHFGMIWSSDCAPKRKLDWEFVEMFMHTLEDMIVQRILEGRSFAKEVLPPESAKKPLIPLSAIAASQYVLLEYPIILPDNLAISQTSLRPWTFRDSCFGRDCTFP